MTDLKPCPFCGCCMDIDTDKYPNGDARIMLYGYHDETCILDHVLWCFNVEEDGWTEESIAEAWNRRVEA